MRCLVVSHFHWDREWYRTFQAYRARLVDGVDTVLELVARDDGFRFVLDGQAVLVEDYLALRPAQREALARAIRAGRVAIGPWYVQPDTLLASGESLIRNLLVGREVCASMGACSGVAYLPDSFGHPAQLPQLFAGFGLVGYHVARSAPDRYGMLLAAGVTTWVIGQAAINLGAVVGLLPVSGITLPFLSAGGSSLVFSMAGAGILANVARQAAPPRRTQPRKTQPARAKARATAK